MRLSIVIIAFLLIGGTAMGDDIQSMVASEKAFAENCSAVGINQAFLNWLLPEGIVFTPKPDNVVNVYGNRPESKRRLDWRPGFATISSDGKMGLSMGPWEIYSDAEATEFSMRGTFFSVWVYSEENGWKVILDAGIVHQDSWGSSDEELNEIMNSSANILSTKASTSLEEAEAKYSQSALETSAAEALEAIMTPATRILRNDLIPLIGEQPEQLYPNKSEFSGFKPLHVKTNENDDFGYCYGEILSKGEEEQLVSGWYTRVWRTNTDGIWKLVAEVVIPAE